MTSGTERRGPQISLLTATCIVVANMVGTGVFTSLGFQVGDLPSGFAILVLWFLGGVCAMCGALCYGELAAAFPRSGGEYHLLSQVYHPAIGFLAGWLSAAVGFAAPVALAAMAFGKYFSHALPLADPKVISIGMVALITAVHLRGVGLGSAFQIAATSFKLLLILGLIGAGFAMQSPQPISFAPTGRDPALIASGPFAISLVYVMYAYSGWNASAYIAGEVREPARNLPRSLALGTLVVSLLYITLNAVFLRSAPMSELGAAREEVSYAAAAHIFGPAGGQRMAGLISFGLISTVSAMMWIGPRVSMVMGEDFRCLRFLARKSAAGAPVGATLAQFAVVVLLLLTSSFQPVLDYIQFGLNVCAFLTVLGVIVLRFRQPDLPRPYRTWGYPVTPLLFLAICLWMIVHQLREKPFESLAGLATMALGLAVYFVASRHTASSATKPL